MIVTYIRWMDACSEEATDPNTPISDSPLVELREVGWLINESDDAVSVGLEIESDDAPSRFRIHIPKCNIVERRDMEVDKAFPVRKRRKI